MTMATPTRPTRPTRRLGRNDPCYCGSGRKYKLCHLREDEQSEQDHREEELAQTAADLDPDGGQVGEWYTPSTRHVPAAERRDFRALVAKLSMTGEHLDLAGPQVLSRDQRGLDEALAYAEERGVAIHCESDPPPTAIAGLQELIDGLYGRGVYRIRPSGTGLHTLGRCFVRRVEGQPPIIGVGGTSQEVLRQALSRASGLEAESQGLIESGLRRVICSARNLRHLTVHCLELPEWASVHLRPLLFAVIEEITQLAEIPLTPAAGQSEEAAVVAASLPFALALPEAFAAPETDLAGMGLDPVCIEILLPHLERIRDRLPWVVRAAEMAQGDWDTFTGFNAWRERLETVPEMTEFLEFSDAFQHATAGARPPANPDDPADTAAAADPDADPDPDEPGEAGQAKDADEAAPPTEEPGGGSEAIAVAVTLPPLPLDPGVFADLATLEERYAERRREIAEHRAAVSRQRVEAQAAHDAVAAQLTAATLVLAHLDDDLHGVDRDLDSLGTLKLGDRADAVVAILGRGTADLAEAGRSWPERQTSVGHAGDAGCLKTISEIAEMRRSGTLVKLPADLRRRLEAEAEAAQNTLRDHYGDLPALAIPTLLLSSAAEPGRDLVCVIPLRAGPGVLAPGGASLAVATAICQGVAAILPSDHPDEIRVVPVGDATLIHWTLSSSGAVTADLLDLAKLGIEEAAERSPQLRRARLRVCCEVTDDLDDATLRAALALEPKP